MKITDYKNEDALDLLADLLDPISAIFSDEELVSLVRGNKPKIEAVKLALKNHKKELIEILARLDGVEPKKYNANIVKMTSTIMEILNDKELIGFFTLSAQTTEATSFGAVTENIEGNEQ